MAETSPGWYHAEGDPPNTQRYWNGTSWDGAPQPVAVMAPPAQLQPWPEPSQAIGALIMSCLGFAFGCVLSPVGMVMAMRERRGIAAGLRDPANKSLADAAFWVGLVGTVVLIVLLLSLLAIAVAVMTAVTEALGLLGR